MTFDESYMMKSSDTFVNIFDTIIKKSVKISFMKSHLMLISDKNFKSFQLHSFA